jgi:DNA-binding response OmpR family regulator
MSIENNAIQLLLVEDDINLGFVIQDTLRQAGFMVHLATDGRDGLVQFNKGHYDLCLLDVMMPKKDGFSLAQDIRKVNPHVPLVFLTAKGMSQDKIKGFQLGADDYITKPFSSDELILRIKAILKRHPSVNKVVETTKQLGEYTFDIKNYELQGPTSSRKLTKKEADLLKLLMDHVGQVLEREIISNLIWGDDSYFIGRSMDVFITRLRKYLAEDQRIAIVNIHGVGFKMTYNAQ